MSVENDRIILEAMRTSRDTTIDCCIEIVRMFTEEPHSVHCAIRALEDFKRSVAEVAPTPSKMM